MSMKENPNTKIRKEYRESILLSRDRILLVEIEAYYLKIKLTRLRSNLLRVDQIVLSRVKIFEIKIKFY